MSVSAETPKEEEANDAISEPHRQEIEKQMLDKTGLKPGEYELVVDVETCPHVPIVHAVFKPQKEEYGRSPLFALLEKGTIVSNWEDGALDGILAAYDKVTPEDALSLAKLAVWFGDFGFDVGYLILSFPQEPSNQEIRQSPLPVLTQEQDSYKVQFYTFYTDYIREFTFDCTLTVTGDKVELSAEQVRLFKLSDE